MRRTLLLGVAALTLLTANAAIAGQLTDLQLADGTSGAPSATIYYTNADGSGSNSEYVYADPQVSFGTTTSLNYCVDLWHDNDLGQTYTINQISSMPFNNSTFADADNRIGWLLAQDQSTPDERAAVQLAICELQPNLQPAPEPGIVSLSFVSVLFFVGMHMWRRRG
jgi:hypothetical protein